MLAAARYVEMKPVRAGLVRRPGQYRWSSAAAHLKGRNDGLARVEPLPGSAGISVEPQSTAKLQAHDRTARPLGNGRFVAKLERRLLRMLRPRRPGRKPKQGRPSRGIRKQLWCPANRATDPLPVVKDPLPSGNGPLAAVDEPLPSADDPFPGVDDPFPDRAVPWRWAIFGASRFRARC